MVHSRLDPEVQYPEIKTLDPDDKDMDTVVYEVSIKGIIIEIATGNEKYNYFEKNKIIYYPIYLLRGGKVSSQIGLYETRGGSLEDYRDDDGDIDIEKLGEPIFYASTTKELLRNNEHLKTAPGDDDDIDGDALDEDSDDNDSEGEDPDDEETDDEQTDGTEDTDDEETDGTEDTDDEDTDDEDTDDEEKGTTDDGDEDDWEQFPKEIDGKSWIETFLGEEGYGIVETEGDGDCLFNSVRIGLEKTSKKTTVAALRKILADNATPEVFEGFKTMYDSAVKEMLNLKKYLHTLVEELKKLKETKAVTKDVVASKLIIEQGEEIMKSHKRALIEYRNAKSMKTEFAFMKGITTLEAFSAIIQTRAFWAETWAISTIERVLNIKLILLSKQMYQSGDIGNVLQCGQLNDDGIAKAGIYEPSHYILCNYLGLHYELITYNGEGALTFEKLPDSIKKLIVDKCMERGSGPYMFIPEFVALFRKLKKKPVEKDSIEEMHTDLFDSDTVFQFYSKSDGSKMPGAGAGETIKKGDLNSYTDLSVIPQWRKKLSNFWEAPFMLDSLKWKSVEHYYQASKFKKENPDIYKLFSMDSDSISIQLGSPPKIFKLSESPVMAKSAGGKSGKFRGKSIFGRKVVLDTDFFTGRSEVEMKAAQTAKFTQNEDLKALLIATKKAKLVHYSRGSPPIIFYDLMEVRRDLALLE